jgi:signal transduction histidine kinase
VTGPLLDVPVCDTQAVEPVEPVAEAQATGAPPLHDTAATLRAAAVRWYRPMAEPATWRTAGYLGLGLVTTAIFGLTVAFLALMVVIAAFTVVGTLLAIPVFTVVSRFADAERSRARLAEFEIRPRPVADDRGWWPRLRARMGDGARWRQVTYHLTAWIVAWSVAVVAVGVWAAVLYAVSLPLWGWAVGLSVPASFLLAATGVLLAPLATRAMVGCAHLEAAFARWLLGPDRFAAMQTQVETLTADRRVILDAIAGERRRIERNLHDGVQARLVALGIDLGMAEAMLPERADEAKALVAAAREKARASIGELRVIGRGLHPSILEDRGLDAALSAVVAASPIPIRLRCELGTQPPPAVEEAAYFIVTEAVSNVLKHARARSATIDVTGDDRGMQIVVHDDGLGGADASDGSGLAGIDARVRGLGGAMRVASPPGGPTVVSVELPYVDDEGRVLR